MDSIYQKILYTISIDYVDYNQIVLEMLEDLDTFSAIQLLDFIVSSSHMKIDEVIIASYLNIGQKDKIFDFHERLLRTCGNISAK